MSDIHALAAAIVAGIADTDPALDREAATKVVARFIEGASGAPDRISGSKTIFGGVGVATHLVAAYALDAIDAISALDHGCMGTTISLMRGVLASANTADHEIISAAERLITGGMPAGTVADLHCAVCENIIKGMI